MTISTNTYVVLVQLCVCPKKIRARAPGRDILYWLCADKVYVGMGQRIACYRNYMTILCQSVVDVGDGRSRDGDTCLQKTYIVILRRLQTILNLFKYRWFEFRM